MGDWKINISEDLNRMLFNLLIEESQHSIGIISCISNGQFDVVDHFIPLIK